MATREERIAVILKREGAEKAVPLRELDPADLPRVIGLLTPRSLDEVHGFGSGHSRGEPVYTEVWVGRLGRYIGVREMLSHLDAKAKIPIQTGTSWYASGKVGNLLAVLVKVASP